MPATLDDLTRTLAPRVERLARHLCGPSAADGAQEVWRELARSWPDFRDDAEPATWAHKIAVRFHSEASLWLDTDKALWQGKIDTPAIAIEMPGPK